MGTVNFGDLEITFAAKNVFIRHGGPRPRLCAGGRIRDVINNIGGSRSW